MSSVLTTFASVLWFCISTYLVSCAFSFLAGVPTKVRCVFVWGWPSKSK